jgi:hypothetical protein
MLHFIANRGVNQFLLNDRASAPMHAASFRPKEIESACTNASGKPRLGLFGLDESFLRSSLSLRCCLCMQLER